MNNWEMQIFSGHFGSDGWKIESEVIAGGSLSFPDRQSCKDVEAAIKAAYELGLKHRSRDLMTLLSGEKLRS